MPQRRPGLVCCDEPAARRAVQVILESCGFDVVASVGSAVDAVLAAELLAPDVAVVDLAVAGDLGLRVVGALRGAGPGCAVIVLVPFEALRMPALAAGAYDAVADAASDLRALERSLRRLAASPARESFALEDRLAAAGGGAQPMVVDSSPPRRSPTGRRRRKAPSS